MPTLLITGASRGLGLEFVRQYAAEGWQVIAACREPAKATALKALAANHPAIQLETLDVTDSTSITALAARLTGQAIDVLINNAGIYSGTGIKDDQSQSFGTLDSAAWLRVLQANTVAPLIVTQALMNNLRLGKDRKIVMISSMMGSINRAPGGAYAYRSSKAALNMAMRNLAGELRAEGFSVVSFHPGWVKTDMGGDGADISPETSVTGMRHLIAGLTADKSGAFLSYDGASLPW